jgi:uncharacterized damage-inducible protein DinB
MMELSLKTRDLKRSRDRKGAVHFYRGIPHRSLTVAALFASICAAQTPMPEVKGTPVTQATLRYIDIQPGTGASAAAGKEFSVTYTGWLTDGKQFDSNIGKKPLKFVQGRRQVIPGFDAGFEGMKVGGKRRIFIPWQLAYGELGRGPIPPKAELIFDVELVDVKDPASTSGPAADLLPAFSAMEEHVMGLANAIPEDKYGWRPAEGVRSIREVLLHIAYGNQLMLNIADGTEMGELTRQVQDQFKREKELLSKEQVIQALTAGFQKVRTAFETATAGSLSRDIRPGVTRRGEFTFIDTHIAEHEGQLVAYARMVGIVPPWSK